MSKSKVTRTEAFTDPNLFGHFFSPIGTWSVHLVIIMALDSLPLNRKQKRIFLSLTGRIYSEDIASKLATILLLMGRRSGKSVLTAFLATYEAYFVDHSQFLKPGEIGTVQVVATDRKQARIILKYLEALFDHSPILQRAIVRRSAETLELNNGIVIQVASCSIRAVRGYTCVAVIAEEAAFWRSDESANPDRDVINALMATMATIPTGKCFILTSPYADIGYVASIYRDHYGQDSDNVLVFRAATQLMNPTIPQSFFDAEEKRDPESFKSEFLAFFRTDRAAFLDPDWIDAALVLPNLDKPRSEHARPYQAFVDMSGGRNDSAALAIAHVEPDDPMVVVSLVRRWTPPFSPEGVAQEMAELMRHYGLASCTGDSYAAELTVELFSKAGIHYQPSIDSASEIYLKALTLFSTNQLEAPDNPVLRRELMQLERRTRQSGRDLVTHPSGSHDDMSVAMCGSALLAWRTRANSGIAVLGRSMVTAPNDGGLVTDFDHSWPRLTNDW